MWELFRFWSGPTTLVINNINSERVWGNNNLYDRKVQEIQNRRERFLLYTYIAWRIVSKDSGDV